MTCVATSLLRISLRINHHGWRLSREYFTARYTSNRHA